MKRALDLALPLAFVAMILSGAAGATLFALIEPLHAVPFAACTCVAVAGGGGLIGWTYLDGARDRT